MPLTRFDIHRPNPLLGLQAAGLGERMRRNRLQEAAAGRQEQRQQQALTRSQETEARNYMAGIYQRAEAETDPARRNQIVAAGGQGLQRMFPNAGPLEPGEQAYDPAWADQLRPFYAAPPKPGALEQKLATASGALGRDLSPEEILRMSGGAPRGPLVSIDNRKQPQVARGYETFQNPETGEWEARPVKGGAAARAVEEKRTQATSAVDMARQRTDRVASLIMDAEKDIRGFKPSDLLNILPGGESPAQATVGLVGKLLSAVHGTPAYDLGQKLLTIRANVGFEQLQELRNAGGTLGQVTEKENELLQAAYASVEQAQSEEALRESLAKLRVQVRQSWRRIADAYRQQYPEGGDVAPPAGVPLPASETIPRAQLPNWTVERVE